MSSDALGDRMKSFEMEYAGRKLMTEVPAMCRIDGRSFSRFTKGMDRPYDQRLTNLIIATTAFLVEETNANMGYTQSDEITLTWYSDNPKSEMLFGGRVQKMESVIASLTTVFFNKELPEFFIGKTDMLVTVAKLLNQMPHFDCRVWSVPTLEEGANCFLWREQDAVKNSVTMAASCYYSHNELMNKHGGDKQEMLFQKGINFNDYPASFKRGTYVQRRSVVRPFTPEEIGKLPLKHEARTNPELMVERSQYAVVDMPPLSKVTNRVQVIYQGSEPLTKGA